ncbi:MAG: pyridine nucleotide-disulfide oxidoreductase [Hyphomicrobiaceae bacterium]
MSRSILRLAPLIFATLTLGALASGWLQRNEGHLTPEAGLGYWLGIIGGTMLLALLLYPLRKRVRFLNRLGSVPGWFRIHMLLGVLGPTLILFHSNFGVGAPNSAVSLVAMLTVVASGIVGRYLYSKVHRGLYGRKTALAEVLQDTALLRELVERDASGLNAVIADLRDFETHALRERRGVLAQLGSALVVGMRARRCSRRAIGRIHRALRQHVKAGSMSPRDARRAKASIRADLALYFSAARAASRFAIYERLFALWHMLHLPLFLLLVVTAAIHIVAVHRY